jgi:hypothetical protein
VRVFLTVVLPLLAPLALYVAYVLLVERRRARAAEDGPPPAWWVAAPWPLLVAAGVGCAAAVAVTLALTGGQEPGDAYRPARMEDGRVVRDRP